MAEPAQDTVDLTSCEREQIHLLGRVQNFGFLVGLTAEWIVSHISDNAGTFIDLDPAEAIGKPASEFLPDETVHAIRNVLQYMRSGALPEVVHGLPMGENPEARFDVTAHIAGRIIILEFEPALGGAQSNRHVNDVQQAVNRLNREPDVASILKQAVRYAAALTGYDRVMAYCFAPDGTGEVVAENHARGMAPYLGLRYPASDIPRQARALYLSNPIRVIENSSEEGSPVMTTDGLADIPIDLSNSVLRSVSPIHLEYLRNMGVGASMSISLIVDGQLWGLLACHHREPKKLPQVQRNAILLFGQMLSFLVEGRISRDENALQDQASDLVNAISRSAGSAATAGEVLVSHADQAMRLMQADGLAVIADGHVDRIGITPTDEEVRIISRRLNGRPAGDIYATSELSADLAAVEGMEQRASGLLSIPISKTPRDYVMFFRLEVRKTVTWAGNPEKPVTVGPNGSRLTPRKSFEAWQALVEGQSEDWTRAQIKVAQQLRITILEVILRLADDAAQERKKAAEKQELLIAELNHRVRNILGLVRSLISQTSAEDVPTIDFAKVLDSRVQALARAHDQITKDNWSPAPVKNLIRTEAAGYLLDKAGRLVIDGDDIMLTPTAYSNVALVVHELMTNSAKYGALADSRGGVEVMLGRRDDGSLDIHWLERNGPPVKAPERRGFGSTIIERSIPFELQGEASIDYKLAGVEARFWIPAMHVRDGGLGREIEAAPIEAGETVPEAGEFPRHVMIVEDNLIIAMDAEDISMRLGAERVTVCANVSHALGVLEEDEVNFAILDLNLGSQLSLPVAERLMHDGIPFIFASGYGESNTVPEALRTVPILAKPYDRDGMQRAIYSSLSRSNDGR